MTLQEKLDTMREASKTRIPPEARALGSRRPFVAVVKAAVDP